MDPGAQMQQPQAEPPALEAHVPGDQHVLAAVAVTESGG